MTTNSKWLLIGTCALVLSAGAAFALMPGPVTPSITPNSAIVSIGQMQMFVTASERIELGLNRIANGSAYVALSGCPKCAANAPCPTNVLVGLIPVLSLNQSIGYGDATFTLTGLSSTTATFSATTAQ
jgi:hypothetical protein